MRRELVVVEQRLAAGDRRVVAFDLCARCGSTSSAPSSVTPCHPRASFAQRAAVTKSGQWSTKCLTSVGLPSRIDSRKRGRSLLADRRVVLRARDVELAARDLPVADHPVVRALVLAHPLAARSRRRRSGSARRDRSGGRSGRARAPTAAGSASARAADAGARDDERRRRSSTSARGASTLPPIRSTSSCIAPSA